MADTGKQSPLGVNVLGALLGNAGLQINLVAEGYMGISEDTSTYTPGSICEDTCLRQLTYSINVGYGLWPGVIDDTTYNNLISIGAGVIPALGNSPPQTYTWTGPVNTGDPSSLAAQTASWNPYSTVNIDPVITSWGFIRLLALQAYNEFNFNNTWALGELKDFLSSFMTSSSFIEYLNSAIMTVQNAKTFLDGTYSNMDDLITGDITGVSLATSVFGKDLINSGKAIDLSSIDTFGMPSKLLLTLQKYNAMTPSLALALQSTDLTSSELDYIMGGGTPTPTQEYNIYQAFTILGGQDLIDILVPLNCKTPGLNTVADLLNVMMLFPQSYTSLTVPIYNTTQSNVNSKIYYPIYVGNAPNANLTSPAVTSAIGTLVPTSLPATVTSVNTMAFTPQEPPVGFGSYLQHILPEDMAATAGAFSVAMLQIKNISALPIEKFAQAVANLETTAGLSVNGTSVPTNTVLANAASAIAQGSGPHGTYTASDFFGCMSGLPYDLSGIQSLITEIQSDTLSTLYDNLSVAVTVAPVQATIQGCIDAINTEIAAIRVRYPTQSAALNVLWDAIGTQLTLEQQARTTGLTPVPIPRDTTLARFPMTQISFVDSMPMYAHSTEPHMYSQTLEAISDWTSIEGQSIIAMLRQERNQAVLNIVGIPLDNNIPSEMTYGETAALITNDPSNLAIIDAAGLVVTPVANGTYTPEDNTFTPNIPTPGTNEDYSGSLGDSPYLDIIPPNLNTDFTASQLIPSSVSPAKALDTVTVNNCDCWNP